VLQIFSATAQHLVARATRRMRFVRLTQTIEFLQNTALTTHVHKIADEICTRFGGTYGILIWNNEGRLTWLLRKDNSHNPQLKY